MIECPDCLSPHGRCRCDPEDDLRIHDAAGACWPRYHRGMPDGKSCRCGKLHACCMCGEVADYRITLTDGTWQYVCGGELELMLATAFKDMDSPYVTLSPA